MVRRTLGLAQGAAAVILGLQGAAVLAFGILALISALSPGSGMAALGIFVAPWLIIGGCLGMASAYGVWWDQSGARLAGTLFSIVVGAATAAAGLGALRIGRAPPSAAGCTRSVADKCVAATDFAPPPADVVGAAVLLGIAALSLATIALLVLDWRRGGRSGTTSEPDTDAA